MLLKPKKLIRTILITSLIFAQSFIFAAKAENIESLRFRETDINTVIRSIAAQAYRNGRRVNIVTSPEVRGLVTIELEDIGWQDALRVVLRSYNYGYEWIGDHMILIATPQEISERRKKDAASREIEPVITEVFRFNFAKVEELQDVVRNLISNRGRVTIDKRTNVLVISDTHSSLDSIRDNVKALDSITPQVLIEAKIIETSFDAEENLGIKWDLTMEATPVAGKYRWPDIPDAFRLGTLDTSKAIATLNFILSNTDAQILSQPKILTMDNSPASIKVVTEDPVPNYSYSTEMGIWEITGFDYIEYGVFLDVTPQINKDGFITLKVEPKVSDRTRDKTFVMETQEVAIPVIETRTASTQVMIKDNETLVIGGLIKDKDVDVITKMPVLGDIPFLGWFFKHRDRDKKKVNLLVFITPRIMTPQLDEIGISQAQE